MYFDESLSGGARDVAGDAWRHDPDLVGIGIGGSAKVKLTFREREAQCRLESAAWVAIILADIEKYGGEDSVMVRCCRIYQRDHPEAAEGRE